jgi:ATP-dependent Lon protease
MTDDHDTRDDATTGDAADAATDEGQGTTTDTTETADTTVGPDITDDADTADDTVGGDVTTIGSDSAGSDDAGTDTELGAATAEDDAPGDDAPGDDAGGTTGAGSEQSPEGEILEVPLLPLRNTVVFPLTVVPLAAAQPRSLRLIDHVMSEDRTVALVLQHDGELENAGPDDVVRIGTLATIHQMMRVPDGSARLAVQGVERIRVLEFTGEAPFLRARVQKIPEAEDDSVEVQALMRNTMEMSQRLASLISNVPDELMTAVVNIDDPRHLVYMIASSLRIEPEERQALLEEDSVREKLNRLNAFLTKELDVLELGKKIQTNVQRS